MHTTEGNRQQLFTCIHVQSFGSQLLDMCSNPRLHLDYNAQQQPVFSRDMLAKYLLQTALKQ